MTELPEDEDKRLELLFRAAVEPVADEGFSERVMYRIAVRAWRRHVILATAGATGIAVAWQPLWSLAGWLSAQLLVRGDQLALLGSQLGTRWPELTGILQNRYALYAAGLALIVPGVLRWLDE